MTDPEHATVVMDDTEVLDSVLDALDDLDYLVARDLRAMKHDFGKQKRLRMGDERKLAVHAKTLMTSVRARAQLNLAERLEDLSDTQLKELLLSDPQLRKLLGAPELAAIARLP